MSITLVPVSDLADDAVVEVIVSAFGKARTPEWFMWKHRDAPWGPSDGMAAIDHRGRVAGVRLLLPWGVRYRRRRERVASRAVEAATAPWAQGGGVFTHLNTTVMAAARLRPWALLFSTPNHRSRNGYAKLGWRLLPHIAHVYRPVAPLGPAVEQGEHVLDDFVRDDEEGIATAWTPARLRWRLDPRSGVQYGIARLSAADEPNGLVYRVLVQRGLRMLGVLLAWGRPAAQAALLRGVARTERAVLLHAVTGPGTLPGMRGRPHGGSVVAVWQHPSPDCPPWPVEDIARWRLAMIDLEGVL